MSIQPAVLIAGAGPTGLTLALALTQNGIPVRLIEKLSAPSDEMRATGHTPRTLEIWQFMGISNDMLKEGRAQPPLAFYDAEGKLDQVRNLFTDLDEPTPAFPNATPSKRTTTYIGQETTSRILQENLRKLGVEVEFAKELVSLEQHEDHVTVMIKRTDSSSETETLKVRYVVGADGGRSTVRKLLDINFPGESHDDVTWVMSNVEIHGLSTDYWHNFGKAPGNVVSMFPTKRAITESVFLCGCGGPTEEMKKIVNDMASFVEFFKATSKNPDIEIGEIKSAGLYKPNNFRCAETFQKGRVLIAGDAGHVHPATGGQGLNSGILDALNLSWKLALVIKGISPPSLLETYTEERLPVIQNMLERTREVLQTTIEANRKDPALLRSQVLHQLGVNYRSSSVVVDDFQDKTEVIQTVTSAYETDGVLRAGCRAPEAPELRVLQGPTSNVTPMRLFDIFRATYHTVLFFLPRAEDNGPADVNAVLDLFARLGPDASRSVAIYPKDMFPAANTSPRFSFVVEDQAGHAFEGYAVVPGEVRIVVVRPDGYVGAMAKGISGIKEYTGNVFNLV